MSDLKRVNIISKSIIEDGKVLQEGGILMRTTRSYAERCIEAGTHSYTSKSKLKSFLNKNAKLYRNERTLAGTKIDLANLGKGNKVQKYSKVIKDPYTGKVYVDLYRKHKEIERLSKTEVSPITGLPMVYKSNEPMTQLLIVKFPG